MTSMRPIPQDLHSEDVLTGVGPNSAPPASLERAVLEAQARRRPLRVLRAWTNALIAPELMGFGTAYSLPSCSRETQQHETEHLMEQALQNLCPEGSVTATAVVQLGSPGHVLSTLSGRGALLVVGANNRSRVANALTGSVVGKLLRHSRTPVMLVPSACEATAFERVILHLDPSRASTASLRWAHEEAARHHCPLEVITVADSTGPSNTNPENASRDLRRLDTFIDQQAVLAHSHPIRVRLMTGRPNEVLCQEAGPQDLLIVQNHRTRGPLRSIRATLAEKVAQSARCSLAVLPEGF